MNYKNKDAETYTAPEGAISAAKKAIKWKEEHGEEVKGGTQVGWTRAHQIANKENLSLETVKRMHSFFSRHKGNETVSPEYKDTPWKDNGYIAWLIWGGNAAAKWAANIVERLDMRELRVDAAVKLSKPRLTSNGYLEVDICLGKVGVLEYWDESKNDVRRELIEADQLLKKDSYETLENVACTNEHPPAMLTPANTKAFAVGYVQKGIKVMDEKLYGTGLITDKKTIDDIKSGKRVEVSPAYETILKPAPQGAVWQGFSYDYIQTDRKYNHLAIVEAGRNGKTVAIKTDSLEFRTDSALVEINNNLDGVATMTTKIKLNEVEYDVSETVATVLTSKFDSDEANKKELMDMIEKLKEDNEKLQAKVDQYKKDMEAKEKEDEEEKKDEEHDEKEEKKDAFDAAVAARVDLLKKAETLSPETKFDGLSNLEIMTKVVSELNPELNMDSKTEAYIEARFDMECETNARKSKGFQKQVDNFDSKNETPVSSSLDVRQKMIDAQKNL